MKKSVTVAEMMKFKPCGCYGSNDGINYTIERVTELSDGGIFTPGYVASLDIPHSDIVWALTRMLDIRECIDFAQWNANEYAATTTTAAIAVTTAAAAVVATTDVAVAVVATAAIADAVADATAAAIARKAQIERLLLYLNKMRKFHDLHLVR